MLSTSAFREAFLPLAFPTATRWPSLSICITGFMLSMVPIAAVAAEMKRPQQPEEILAPQQLAEMRQLLGTSSMELLTLEEGAQVQGLLMLWNLEGMVFLENFAVSPSLRGQGMGAKMLEYVWDRWNKPMLLEVEPPEGQMQRRRIGFYERNGFYLNHYPYQMPCLHGDGPSLPLLLMSRPDPLTDQEARQVAERLYQEVYAGKRRPELP